MAKEIGFNEVEDYLTALGNFFAQSTGLEADAKIKEATPSTTGRLRASWQIGENAVSQASEAPANIQKRRAKASLR